MTRYGSVLALSSDSIAEYKRLHAAVWPEVLRQIKASGINPVSQMDFAQHAPVEAPAQALVWLCSDDAAEFAGQEVSLRDPAIRARVGLV